MISKRLLHALADGDARHDDDELAPAVALVQLEDRLDVAVGLAGAGLHLDVEIDRGDTLVLISAAEMGRFWPRCTFWMFSSTLRQSAVRSAFAEAGFRERSVNRLRLGLLPGSMR